MANICTNILFVSGINNETEMERIKKIIDENFECYYVDEGEDEVEIGFSSKYRFPAKELKEITGDIDELKMCIDVLSYDFSNNYARYHQYINGQWKDVWSGETI